MLNDPFQLTNKAICMEEKCKEKIKQIKELMHSLKKCKNRNCQKIENKKIFD